MLTKIDHDIDDEGEAMLNVYNARGVLIESRGPTWIYGSSNEHSSLYQWQFYRAQCAFLSHVQSETAYYQAGMATAEEVYPTDDRFFSDDPLFLHCSEKPGFNNKCNEGWALRLVQSQFIYIYGGGFYSFFQDYKTTCSNNTQAANVTCQDSLVDINYSGGLFMLNIFTVGANEVISPQG
jgi:glucan 1,3-beta-glucosidase